MKKGGFSATESRPLQQRHDFLVRKLRNETHTTTTLHHLALCAAARLWPALAASLAKRSPQDTCRGEPQRSKLQTVRENAIVSAPASSRAPCVASASSQSLLTQAFCQKPQTGCSLPVNVISRKYPGIHVERMDGQTIMNDDDTFFFSSPQR